METEKWFKLKRYPHIGLPITVRDYDWIKAYVNDEVAIKQHAFLPFVHKCIVSRKYRPNKDAPSTYNPSGKRRRNILKSKIRHIYYASHLDSLIFSFYNDKIACCYEDYVRGTLLDASVVAYRKIEVEPDSGKHKCNIDFAKSAFEFIRERAPQPLTVIVADVTSFFDTLDHKILKRQWAKVLDDKCLPDDHYNLFKALTRITYVESEQLFDSYGKSMLVKQGVANHSKKWEYKRKVIKSLVYGKEKNAVSYCKKSEFLNSNLNLVVSKNNLSGIPQGTAISATLANVYMIEFDELITEKIHAVGGFYQRYSDDLICVVPRGCEDDVIKLIWSGISDRANLTIEPNKTKVYHFEEVDGQYSGFNVDEKTKKPKTNLPLVYLGFSFDGKRVLVKNSGFAKFYRSMKRSVKRSASLAMNGKNPDRKIFKRRLYQRFSYLGAKRKLIYRPSKDDNTRYERTLRYYWGNYLSYIYKADDLMLALNGKPVIRRQSRHFWRDFNSVIKRQELRVLRKQREDGRQDI